MVDENIEPTINEKKSILKKFNFLELFKGKNLKILLLAFVGILILLLYLNVGQDNKSEDVINISNNNVYTSTMEYSTKLENKLEQLLSQIDGAGSIKVMVSLNGSPELVYASDNDIKTTSNSSGTVTSTSSSLILVSQGGKSDALILKENLPSVKGVIVVSSGASNIGVKMDILNSVSTLLDISIDKISVLKGI